MRNKIMWIMAFIPTVVTIVVLKYMPDTVPVHYDVAGEIDRWGSKYEHLIFPIMIIGLTIFWKCLMLYFQKRKSGAMIADVEAERNLKVIGWTAISMNIVFLAMQCVFLYVAYKGTALKSIDFARYV